MIEVVLLETVLLVVLCYVILAIFVSKVKLPFDFFEKSSNLDSNISKNYKTKQKTVTNRAN